MVEQIDENGEIIVETKPAEGAWYTSNRLIKNVRQPSAARMPGINDVVKHVQRADYIQVIGVCVS